MKPDVDRVLQVLSENLLFELAPRIEDGYAQSSAQLTGMLLTAAVEEWDRVAERRVAENASLRALFKKARSALEGTELARKLEEASKSKPKSMRISDLDVHNDRLRFLLIELHAAVEELEGAKARRVEDAIWEELLESTVRRKLSIAPF